MTTELLTLQLGFTHYVIKKNIEGLSHEQTLVQPQPGGNCLNWVLGHILASRNGLLKVLGQEPIWSSEKADRYRRGSDPITRPSDAVPLDEMVRDLDASQERILQAMKRFPAEALGKPAPFSPTGNDQETVGSLLAGLAFHEAYHGGQTGVLRRLAGKAGSLT
jgi:uncharacterized damage-inducible protein DinB